MTRISSFFCLHLSVLTLLHFLHKKGTQISWTKQSPASQSFLQIFSSNSVVSKHECVILGPLTQNLIFVRPKVERIIAVLLTNMKTFKSHASRAAATSKPSFTMSTEGDVFYVYVKRQLMSTVISADECLWKFLLEVLCCLGAHCMIKSICTS